MVSEPTSTPAVAARAPPRAQAIAVVRSTSTPMRRAPRRLSAAPRMASPMSVKRNRAKVPAVSATPMTNSMIWP